MNTFLYRLSTSHAGSSKMAYELFRAVGLFTVAQPEAILALFKPANQD